MKNVNNKAWYIVMIVFGIALITAGILLNLFKGDDLKSLCGVFIGIGAAMTGQFIGKLFIYLHWLKHPEIQRKTDIESRDERNTLIRDKAAARTNYTSIWLLFAAIMVFILLDAELYITLVLASLIVVNSIVNSVFCYYYNKRL